MGRPLQIKEEQVVDTAMNLFWEKGFSQTSTRDIIKNTGISNGSFFNSFEDKSNLYLTCLVRYREIYMSKLEDMLIEEEPFIDKLRKILLYVVRKEKGKNSYIGCFHFNTVLDETIQDREIQLLSDEISRSIGTMFKKAIQKAIKNKEFKKTIHAENLTQYILTLISGLRVLLRTEPDKQIVSNIIETTIQSVSTFQK
ncbi:MAG: TetR/AcrR family transcriptional regulator [Chitinophagaceae bacterium]|nr:MAG: TetR/AcrR family transcriptional regulator [Chitinophagaceae bacterium]